VEGSSRYTGRFPGGRYTDAPSFGFCARAKRVSLRAAERGSMKAGQSKQWLLATAIIFLTFLVYQPVWHASFVWDDDFYVTDNPSLKTVDGLRSIWCDLKTTRQYYPVTVSTLWAEYHIWNLHPLGYHLVNVLIHALNAILLWRVLRKLGLPGSWLAAAIFAVHPVTVESVAWISERKNVLSCLFYLLAVLAFLRFRPLTDAKAGRTWDWRFYPVMLAAFLCALLSKTVTCSLPAALLLVVWWKTGRIKKRDALAMAPLFVLGAALGLMSKWEEQHLVGAGGAEWALSSLQRCLLAGRALWFYAGKLFWPRDLTFIYPHWQIDTGAAWQYLFPLAFAVVVLALWKLRSRIGRGPLAAVLFFAGTPAASPSRPAWRCWWRSDRRHGRRHTRIGIWKRCGGTHWPRIRAVGWPTTTSPPCWFGKAGRKRRFVMASRRRSSSPMILTYATHWRAH
jgi:hypothetical protein